MGSYAVGAAGKREHSFEDQRGYEPPSLIVLGTVQELTGAGVAGQSDGVGFEELGGS